MASIIVVTLEDIHALEKELHQRRSLKRLKVNEIRANQDYSGRYILGKIRHTGTLVKHAKLPIQYRKLNIEESETRECIHVVLVVDCADEKFSTQMKALKDDNLRLNDVLVFTNFKIEANPLFPNHDSSNMFQAIVNLSLVGSIIMVVRSKRGSDDRKRQHQDASSLSIPPRNRQHQDASSGSIPPRKRQHQDASSGSIPPRKRQHQDASSGSIPPKNRQHQDASSLSILPTPNLSRSKTGQKDPYVYVKLSDLTIGTVVNIFGVVKFVKDATKTRGPDYSMVVSITDETRKNTYDKLKCNLFGRFEKLPSVKLRQIIRFHRLKITTFKGELQGQFCAGFSWVVFDGTVGAPLTPISTSSINNTLTDEDEETVKQLRLWAESADINLSQNSISHKKHPSLSEISLNQYFDLTCQVVGKCIIVEGESMLLKVWDGTPVGLNLYSRVLSDDLASRFQFWSPLAQLEHRYVADVTVYDNHFYDAAQVNVGDFIILQNLHAQLHVPRPNEKPTLVCPSAELSLHKGASYNRGLTVLKSTSAEVVTLKRKLDTVFAENYLPFDSTEELWTQTPSASPSGIRGGAAAAVTSTARVMSVPKQTSSRNSICEESSEEFFTPPLPPGNGRAPISKTPVIAADSVEEEDFRVEETDLAENDENLPNDGNSASENACPSTGDVPPMKRKFNFSKALLEGKENAKVDENETADSHDAERVATSMGSQCSIESSHDFASDRCMLTTATVLVGHSHIAITRVDKIQKHAHPGKFRFQGYAINYTPNSDSVDGFLRLYCQRCRFSCPLPTSDDYLSLNFSQFSGSIREPELRCTDNGISTYTCPYCRADLEYIFMVEFVLNDGTGQLYAGLWRQEANNFFGCTPLDLLRNPSAYKEIKEKLNVMCFGLKTCQTVDRLSDMDKSEAVLMECCLKSYSVPCGIAYQIFDTMFAATS